MGVGPGTIGTWDHAFICICWSWDRPGTEVSWGPNGKEQIKQESKRKKSERGNSAAPIAQSVGRVDVLR